MTFFLSRGGGQREQVGSASLNFSVMNPIYGNRWWEGSGSAIENQLVQKKAHNSLSRGA